MSKKNTYVPQHEKKDFSHLKKEESRFHMHEKSAPTKGPQRLTIPRGRNS